jgi:hypothetical protein
MGSGNKFLPWVALIVLFVGFQAVFILADCRRTAPQTAEEFIKAYYALDPSMSHMVCNDLKEDETEDPVVRFIENVSNEAETLGHNLNYMRSQLLSLHAKTVSESEDSAVIHVTGTRKRCVHPVFTFVARLFFLGDTFPVDKTLTLVREDGRWRVCNDVFNPVDARNIYGHSI